MLLNLEKPIVFFDLETTGVNVGTDHIVEICLLKVNPDQTTEQLVHRVRPVDSDGKTIHIPEFTTAIHGISDADVADKPSFTQLAPEIASFIGDADLAGYNSNKFDVPLLVEEFLRAGLKFDLKSRRLIDVQNIFHKMEQRTLKAAYRFYCGKNLDHAHSADADTMATYEVLMAQLDRYQDSEYTAPDGSVSKPIVNNIEQLSQFTCNSQWADLVGHIGYDKQHREIFNFGKHKGKTLESVFNVEPAYYDWMMKADFPLSTKECITEVWKRRQDKKMQDLKLHFTSKF
ncbi:MAG: 3'-5' exonuclease [Bacteroidales bacterium]|jgi:DNA polymerase-3 subunit epsilon|nr:3'-5' exonuclease [Bacteroidales bacterium]MBR3436008.1 3'-5' exonuclease [Bacteroidales bacterium]